MRRKKGNPILTILLLGVLLAGGGAIVYAYWGDGQKDTNGNYDAGNADTNKNSASTTMPIEPETRTGPIDPEKDIKSLSPIVPISADEALKAYTEGLTLAKIPANTRKPAQTLKARDLLSRAYFSGFSDLSDRLSVNQANNARSLLTTLANETIFSPVAIDGDPYTMYYTFQGGDTLSGVERKFLLRVPFQLLAAVNPTMDPINIWKGTRVKLVRGTFHAIVYKSQFVMDIYLKRYDGPITFVRRIRVGLGKDDSTPLGAFQVALGKKLIHAPWNPPPASTVRQTILWSRPGYPMGPEGRWIALKGVDDKTKLAYGYGIHGTNDPLSIGKAQSLGCIRLGDEDIELIFSLLYEKWSSVYIAK